jgi:hypothetical protein
MSDLKLLLELLKVKDDPKFMEIMAIVQQTVDDNDKITPTQIKAIIKDLTKPEPTPNVLASALLSKVPDPEEIAEDALVETAEAFEPKHLNEPKEEGPPARQSCPTCGGKGWV